MGKNIMSIITKKVDQFNIIKLIIKLIIIIHIQF